jgi:hypothetical protein
MLLVSLPESEIEQGGEVGRDMLEQLSHVVGRIEAVWKLVTASESFEIVRRRLFTESVDYAARDAILDAFSRMYRMGNLRSHPVSPRMRVVPAEVGDMDENAHPFCKGGDPGLISERQPFKT